MPPKSFQVPTTRTVVDPHVEVLVDLSQGRASITLSELCPACAGYGAPCAGQGCSGGRVATPVTDGRLADMVGVEAAEAVRQQLRRTLEIL